MFTKELESSSEMSKNSDANRAPKKINYLEISGNKKMMNENITQSTGHSVVLSCLFFVLGVAFIMSFTY